MTHRLLKNAMKTDCHYCGVVESAGAEPAVWPDSCRGNLRVSIHPGFRTHSAFRHVDFDALVRRALAAWSHVIDVRFTVMADWNPNGSEIYMQPAALPGSTLADSFLAQNTCHVSLRQRYDTTIQWGAGMLYSTIVHELGHALGLHHNRSSSAVMYYQITGPWIDPQPQDVEAAKRLGYRDASGDPEDPAPPEPPQPPEPPVDPPAPPEPPEGPTLMDRLLDLLLDIVLGQIGDCMKSQDPDRIKNRLISRDRFVVRRLKWMSKRLAIRTEGRQWWRENGEALEAAALDEYERLSDADVEALVDEAVLVAVDAQEDAREEVGR